MNNTFKKIVILAAASLLCLSVLTFYFVNEFRNSRAIGDVDNLSGQKIGVVSAYEGDYLLSDREDITLLRYDTESDLLVALCYQKVDAIAVATDNANYYMSVTTGLKINDKPIDHLGMCSLFEEDSNLMHEYNDFIAEFKQTEEYQEYLYRVDNQLFYDGSQTTPETGTGETINVGYITTYIPVVFKDAINKIPNGSEVEFLRLFANAHNYKINWIEVSESTTTQDLLSGKMDIILAGYSDVYRDEYDVFPVADLGDNYRECDLLLLEIEDPDNLSIGALYEEEE